MTLSKFFIFLYSILSLQLFALLLDCISLLLLFLSLILSLYITFSVGRKFDKLFRDINPVFLPDLGWYTTVLRSLCYARLIASKNRLMPKKIYKERYGDYDFYENASPLQRKASVLYFVFGILTLVFMITGILL